MSKPLKVQASLSEEATLEIFVDEKPVKSIDLTGKLTQLFKQFYQYVNYFKYNGVRYDFILELNSTTGYISMRLYPINENYVENPIEVENKYFDLDNPQQKITRIIK